MLDHFSDIFRDMGLSRGWLFALLVAFPLAILFLGEVINRARRRRATYTRSLSLLRNIALPLLAVYFLLTHISDYDAGSTELKVLVTLTSIITLIAILGVVNGVLFSGRTAAVADVPKLFLDLARVVLVGIGIAIVASTVWGLDLGELVTALGVSSIVIGLALQDTLGNLFSGITLLYERPFAVGDFIQVDDYAGRVVEVNWRSVRIVTREQDLIVLPHYMVAQGAILNRSQPVLPWVQKVELGFSYDDAPNRVKRMLMEVLAATPEILAAPEPEVKTIGYGDFAVQYEIEYAIPSWGMREEIDDDFMTRVWYAAQRHGITIPFPTRTVYNGEIQHQRAAASSQTDRHLDRAERLLSGGLRQNVSLDAGQTEVVHFGRGERVLDFHERDASLYIVLGGEAHIYATDLYGELSDVVTLQTGDLFTELVMPGTRDNVIRVETTSDCQLLRLGERALRRLANRNDGLAQRIDEVNQARRRQVAALKAEERMVVNGGR